MKSIIKLPSQFEANSLFKEMATYFKDGVELPREVEMDFSGMHFVWPSGIVFLSNLTIFLVKRGVKVYYVGIQRRRSCIQFLDDSRFFQQHLGEPLQAGGSPRATTMPLRRVLNVDSHAWLDTHFVPWLSRCSQRKTSDFSELRTCLSEVFNNIEDHAGSDEGSIFAQWYPNKKRLRVALADFGVGIPITVRRIKPYLSDSEALIEATHDGFSSMSSPRNRGVGLHYMIQNIVERFRGELVLRSGGGAVRFENGNDSARYTFESMQGVCPGTMLEMTIRTDLIQASEDEVEDFEW